MGWFSKEKKEPKDAQDLLKKLKVERNAAALVLHPGNKGNRRLDRQALEDSMWIPEEKKKEIYEPVKLDQEYRDFDFESPWEGTKYIKQVEEKNKTKKK